MRCSSTAVPRQGQLALLASVAALTACSAQNAAGTSDGSINNPDAAIADAISNPCTMVAIGSAPHVEFRLNQGTAWDGIAVALSDHAPPDQTGLAGELRSSSAQNSGNRITTTNSAGVPDLYAWTAGNLRLQGQFNTSMFDANYQMLGQSINRVTSRAEPIPTGGGWWKPAASTVRSVAPHLAHPSPCRNPRCCLGPARRRTCHRRFATANG